MEFDDREYYFFKKAIHIHKFFTENCIGEEISCSRDGSDDVPCDDCILLVDDKFDTDFDNGSCPCCDAFANRDLGYGNTCRECPVIMFIPDEILAKWEDGHPLEHGQLQLSICSYHSNHITPESFEIQLEWLNKLEEWVDAHYPGAK